MPLILSRRPALEPVTAAEALTHCRLSTTDDDGTIARLIPLARQEIEAALGLALVSQGWTWRRDRWPAGSTLPLPLRPVTALTAVRIADAARVMRPASVTAYALAIADDGAAMLSMRDRGNWPAPGVPDQGIEIGFDAGYGTTAEAVPAPIRQALLLLVALAFENREPLRGAGLPAFPPEVARLLAPYRRVRL